MKTLATELLRSIVAMFIIASVFMLLPTPTFASSNLAKIPLSGPLYYFDPNAKSSLENQEIVGIQDTSYYQYHAQGFSVWYNSNWSYRKEINITGSPNGTQTNYPLAIKINRTTGSDTGNMICIGTKCNETYNDIRITTSDGSTLLPYWLQDDNTTSIATVWANFNSINIGSGNISTFYIYYGNNAATSSSSMETTFSFCDDFNDGSLNTTKWTQPSSGGGSRTESGGKLIIIKGSTKGYLYAPNDTFNNGYGSGWAVNVRWSQNDSTPTGGRDAGWIYNSGLPGIYDYDKNHNSAIRFYGGDTYYTMTTGSTSAATNHNTFVAVDNNTYHIGENQRINPSKTKLFFDGSAVTAGTFRVYNGTAIPSFYLNSASNSISADWIFVRKVVESEPSISVFGSEETLAGGEPTVVTLAASNVNLSNATMNGNLTNTNSATVTHESFIYSTTSNTTKPSTGEAPPASRSFSYISSAGNYSVGTFEYNATSLTNGTLYYYRAGANSTSGWGWGDETSFLTYPEDPSNLSATGHPFVINLTWTNGVGANITIRYSTSGYPANSTDGTLAYTGSATSLVLSGLGSGKTYYFRGWSVIATGGFTQYSTGYTSASASTPISAHANAGLSLVIVGKATPNTNYTMPLNSVEIENTGTVAIDIAIRGDDIAGGIPWTLSDTATVGNNTYGLKAGVYGGSYDVIVKKTSPYNTLISNLGLYSSQQFGLILFTPSTVSDGVTKIGSVSLVVTAH